ncbi:unnamed protein product, partial [Closterium sp. NIES-54]
AHSHTTPALTESSQHLCPSSNSHPVLIPPRCPNSPLDHLQACFPLRTLHGCPPSTPLLPIPFSSSSLPSCPLSSSGSSHPPLGFIPHHPSPPWPLPVVAN